jgi:hypothetical protein
MENEKLECEIVWGCEGFLVSVMPVGVMRQVMRALQATPEDMQRELRDNLGFLIVGMMTELRALGVRVSVQIQKGHVLRHVCGRSYTPEQWSQLIATPLTVTAICNGKSVVMPTRTCGCGSTISYASLDVTHPEAIVCNAHGGQA